MLNVLLTIHMIACIALVVAVMLQRSEGGALGMSGGGTGGLISGRGAAGVLVKTTMALAAVFFITSITMTALNNSAANQSSVLERQVDAPASTLGTPGPAGAAAPDPLAGVAAPAAPAPAAPAAPSTTADPLAPATNTTPAPATPAPTTPAPASGNGGTPN